MSDLLITTVAEGRYINYAEMWELALSKAYPEYDYEIEPMCLKDGCPKYFGACMRYIGVASKNKVVYKYTYITDIDMMIVREKPTLLDFHLKEIQESGLCYSNSPRGSERDGPNRLTGLHFVTEDWWDKTCDVRLKYYRMLLNKEIGEGQIDDELMLMRIVKESGLEVAKPVVNLMERHHGLHLGTVRAHKTESLQSLRRAVSIRVNKDKATKWQEVVACPEYSKILGKIQKKDRMAYEEFMIIDKFTKQISKG